MKPFELRINRFFFFSLFPFFSENKSSEFNFCFQENLFSIFFFDFAFDKFCSFYCQKTNEKGHMQKSKKLCYVIPNFRRRPEENNCDMRHRNNQ